MPSLVLLLSVIFSTSPAFANSSTYATCTGEGWTIELGLNPGNEGTDLIEVSLDDGSGQLSAFEALITSGRFKRVLKSGVVLNNKQKIGDQGTLRLLHHAATWQYRDTSFALTCQLI